uniref:Uncharacterized protein n=1 Tax=Arundo donax TaxID=35708 RepID=A0A0A9U5G0_ARUDO
MPFLYPLNNRNQVDS